MLWIYLIILQILFFGGLLYFLRYVLTRNIRKATGRLQELSQDYVAKEEEANRFLQNAQKEAKSIVAKETQVAEEAKEKVIKEAHEMRARIVREANQKGAEIAEKAERNADFLRNELERKIDERAKEKVSALVQQVLPEEFLREVHERWVDESGRKEFNLKNLKFPEKIKEAKIVSAFPLTDKQQGDLKKKLKKKAGADVILKLETDPSLITGFIMTVGSIVVDASLKYRIQKAMQE